MQFFRAENFKAKMCALIPDLNPIQNPWRMKTTKRIKRVSEQFHKLIKSCVRRCDKVKAIACKQQYSVLHIY